MGSEEILKRLEKLFPKAIDLSLDRVLALLNKLGNPQDSIKNVVHLAGTNGKGSTLTFIKKILECKGYSVNSFISPHLMRFNERINLDGSDINDDYLFEILEYVERINNNEPITFFEITTAAAYLAFKDNPADALMLETGMGGRLDATNVVKSPLAAVITPISYDHQAYLGNTIKEIALEKAHIIKPGHSCISAYQGEAEAIKVIKVFGAECGSAVYQGGEDWQIKINPDKSFNYYGKNWGFENLPQPSLLGEHQYFNAGTAIATLEQIKDVLPVNEDNIRLGIEQAFWPARLQKLTYNDLDLWLDGGHNPHAAYALEKVLQGWQDKPLTIITGMLTTKDAPGYYKIIAKYAAYIFTVTIEGSDVTYTAKELAEIIKADGFTNAKPTLDFRQALDMADKNSRILICGSLYLAGNVLSFLNNN